ncbi:TonB-dependent receptor [Granulicella sibirica]|uniref:Oar protein n=1 Tax=Granulicella sibirica TaxID=2479048 RepID=A0A4Q0T9W0_9BACT|nr:TonB-dependent receptor [Granulicella sibirica]RXH58839.1 Oar protein [Granulicella sibirica]
MQSLRSFFFLALLAISAGFALAQGTSGSVTGTVTDSTGAVIPDTSVQIANPVSGFTRKATTDASGVFHFYNIPFDRYRLTATSSGFDAKTQNVAVNSVVPMVVAVQMTIAGSSTEVTVDAGADLTENDSTFHTDIDRAIIDKLPLESASSQLSSLVTLSSPGVAADSNGLFHGLGDHAENSFSLDGQPITDQQSKVFSNQIPADAVQSLEVIDGAPPAEYGDKTSLVIKVTTRSGQGVTKPTGEISTSYGSFGSADVSGNLAFGTKNFGNFIAVSGLNSGRFLDPGEFAVLHDKGNLINFFDRVDYQFSDVSSVHTNLQYTRSWFQTPNSYDTLNVGATDPITGALVGQADQRSKIETYLFAPTYTRTISNEAVLNFAPYFRRDSYQYYPSKNPFADLGPIQQETVGQQRSLLNAGVHSDLSYSKGVNNIKIGGMYQQTFLRENDQIGLVDPTLNSPCLDANGNPLPGTANPATCANPNPNFNPILLPYDLTRGGGTYSYHGQTDVKQLAFYAQDQVTIGNFLMNAGMRGDIYNGLAIQRQAEPRLGLSYNFKKTNTVIRASYARAQETPFNENLVLSSTGCTNAVIQAVFETLGTCQPAPFNPGFRNEIHAGIQQGIGKHFVIGGDYIWKYTHNAYDFSVLGATPITFPIEWHNSKIPGFAARANLTEVKGFSAFVVMSSVAARFFNPQVGGVGATVGRAGGLPFRIDHDERFNETTHIQYALPFRKSLWYGFNWRYDSGLVAGAAPCYNVLGANSGCAAGSITLANGQPGIDLSGLTADEQFQAGLICNGVKATPTSGFTSCAATQLTSKLLSIPAPNTEDDDRNPPRIAPRSLFDMVLGDDNLFNTDKHRISARITAVNVTNKYALYNFLSTFSGTHYVSPRTVTAQVSYSF